MNDGRSWGLKLSGILISLVLLAACGQDAAQPNSSGRDQAGAGGNGDSTGTAGPTETVVASENIEVPGKTGYKDSYYEVEWSANDSTMIALGGSSAQISGSGAAFADGTLTITEGGHLCPERHLERWPGGRRCIQGHEGESHPEWG